MRILPPDQLQQFDPVHGGQLQVGDHHVGPIHQPDRLFGRARLIDVEAGRQQVQLDHSAQLLFVDNQDPFSHFRRGKKTRNTLPFCGSLSTAILPPCSSTIFETIGRPSPTPSGLVVKNGLKMLSRSFGSMPEPRSITAISTISPASLVLIVIVPPDGVACAALSSRLKKTRSIMSASSASSPISGA